MLNWSRKWKTIDRLTSPFSIASHRTSDRRELISSIIRTIEFNPICSSIIYMTIRFILKHNKKNYLSTVVHFTYFWVIIVNLLVILWFLMKIRITQENEHKNVSPLFENHLHKMPQGIFLVAPSGPYVFLNQCPIPP